MPSTGNQFLALSVSEDLRGREAVAVAMLVLHHGSVANKAMELNLCLARTGSFPYQTVLHIQHRFMEIQKPWSAELLMALSGDTQTYHLNSA